MKIENKYHIGHIFIGNLITIVMVFNNFNKRTVNEKENAYLDKNALCNIV